MKIIYKFFALNLLLPMLLFSNPQDKEFCIQITQYIFTNIDSLDSDSLSVFFNQFAIEKNLNNAEFSECSNGALFLIAENHPELFFNILFTKDPTLLKTIQYQMLNPVVESINLIKIFKHIENCDLNENIKLKAIEFIRPSYNKYKEMIETWEKNNNEKWPYN